MSFVQKYIWGSVDGSADAKPPDNSTANVTTGSDERLESGTSQLHGHDDHNSFNPLEEFTTLGDDRREHKPLDELLTLNEHYGLQEQGYTMAREQNRRGEGGYQTAVVGDQRSDFAGQERYVAESGYGQANGYPDTNDDVRVPEQELGSGKHEQHSRGSQGSGMGFMKQEPDVDDASFLSRAGREIQRNRMTKCGDEAGRLQEGHGDGEQQRPDEEMADHTLGNPSQAREAATSHMIKNEFEIEQQTYDEAMEDQTDESAGKAPNEVATAQEMKSEPSSDEQILGKLQNGIRIQEHNRQHPRLTENAINQAGSQPLEGSGERDIMDFYGIDAMNDADARDQPGLQEVADGFWSGCRPDDATESGALTSEMHRQDVPQGIGSGFRLTDATPSGFPSSETQRQIPQNFDDDESKLQVDALPQRLSDNIASGPSDATAREQRGNLQRARQQAFTGSMDRYGRHRIPEPDMQNRTRAEHDLVPIAAGFQAQAFDGHDGDQDRKPRPVASRRMDDDLAYAKGRNTIEGRLMADQVTESNENSTRQRVEDGRVGNLQHSPRDFSRKGMRVHPSHLPEHPPVKQQLFHSADFQLPKLSNNHPISHPRPSKQGVSQQIFHRPASSTANHINRPDHEKRGLPHHNSIAANSPRKNVAMPDAPDQYGRPVADGSPSYYSGPPSGLEYVLGFGHFDSTFGQAPMPFMPPQQEQQRTNMYDPNTTNPYFRNYFYDHAQMAMAGAYQQPFSSPPQHGYHMSAPAPTHALSNPYMTPQSIRKRKAQEAFDVQAPDEDEESSDDEPLVSRTRRHHSLNSRSGATESVLGQKANFDAQAHEADDIQLLDSTPKQKFIVKIPFTKASRIELKPAPKKVAPLPRPLLQPIPQSSPPVNDSDNDDPAEISWKLPTFAVDPQPIDPETDQRSLKVSIPGMVREVVLLSPDHATQETHLYTHLFLPGQQALAVPDPTPNIATLNFHTVAVMVLDAYAAFEAGDELTNVGRQNRGAATSSNTDDADDEDTQPKNDARDADVDEIFFAAIDRWRAGKLSNKKSYSLIRGVQEFCDIALDIIYYIHEHGLLREHNPNRMRKEMSDKGVKRGPREQKVEEEAVVGKKRKPRGQKAEEEVEKKRVRKPKVQESNTAGGKGKRKATGPTAKAAATGKAKVNVLQGRKKVKTGKAAQAGVIVNRRKSEKGK